MKKEEIRQAAIKARMGLMGPVVRCSTAQLEEFVRIILEEDRTSRKPIDEERLEDMWGESVSVKKPDFDAEVLEFARNIEKFHKIA
jgi:hypothetical protein